MLALGACGAAAIVAFLMIAIGDHRLGSPAFLGWTAVAVAAYGAALVLVWRTPQPRRALLLAGLLALAMRVPMTVAPVGAGSDMLRYVWDARAQRAGVSPYEAIPSRPEFAHLHTPETRQMNNRNIPSPYPPGAQVFFRLVTAIHESTMALKIALVACDLAVAAILVAWLRGLGRNPLWMIAYAWNPLVVLETAYSGHLDAAGALAVTAAAFALSRGRPALSVAALSAGIAIKFLPIVLVPLYWKRARVWHGALAAGFLIALYLPFADIASGTLPLGSVSNMIRGFRFNGPAFQALEFLADPWRAAMAGVAFGGLVAVAMRRRLPASEPAAWAWPMAAALVCSPVVYPWYLVWLTPFFISALAAPLVLWSVLILPVYVVWHGLLSEGIWAVPTPLLVLEYAGLASAIAWLLAWRARARRPA